jgi:hypothetical protein
MGFFGVAILTFVLCGAIGCKLAAIIAPEEKNNFLP